MPVVTLPYPYIIDGNNTLIRFDTARPLHRGSPLSCYLGLLNSWEPGRTGPLVQHSNSRKVVGMKSPRCIDRTDRDNQAKTKDLLNVIVFAVDNAGGNSVQD
jgi:hypothetical protein